MPFDRVALFRVEVDEEQSCEGWQLVVNVEMGERC